VIRFFCLKGKVPIEIDSSTMFYPRPLTTGLGPPKLKARGMFLHLDNPRRRLCNDDFEELGIRRLLYSWYSSDLAPCAFWLSGYLNQCLEGQSFDNPMALQAAGSEI
jgi:hypothetical protein